jgi:glycosyltransferase involved in cell wall biosynthesis
VSLGLRRLIVINGSPLPSVGGIQNYTLALVGEALRLGYEPIVVASGRANEPYYETAGAVHTYRLRSLQAISGRFPIPYDPRQLVRLLREVFGPRDRALVVIQARFYPTSPLFAFAARIAGYPCAIVDHGAAYLTLENPLLDAVGAAYEHAVTWLERAARPTFYGVSDASVRWLASFGIRDARIASNGVQHRLLEVHGRPVLAGDEPLRAIYCGRLLAQKGMLQAIDAFAQLEREQPGRFQLTIVGDGPLEAQVAERSATTANVTFAGRRTHAQTLEAMADSDVVLSPSTWPEGLCTASLEAGALGRVLAATSFGGGADLLIANQTGVLLEDAEPPTIARAMLALSADRDSARRFAAALRDRIAANYTWPRIFEPFLAQLGEVQTGRAGAAKAPRPPASAPLR